MSDRNNLGRYVSQGSLKAGSFLLSLILFAAVSSRQPAFAQTDTGAISGLVTDSSGAVVPGATVTLTNTTTSQERVTGTDSSGVYSFPNIPPGVYALEVKKEGFTASKMSGIPVELQHPVRQDITLQPGTTVTEITVAASQVQLQTESHDVTQLQNPEQLEQLPTNGRSLLSLTTLAPTMAPGSVAVANPGDSSFYGTVSNQVAVAGMTDSSTLFLQDGVENVNLITVTMNIVPSVESLQEVNTTMNGADARYAEPSVINIITKGGVNKFHGTAYDFLQNNALDAENYNLAGGTPPPKAAVRYNLFGGNFGGPILKNKVFGFFDYSGLRSGVGGPTVAVVPTQAEKEGNFSADPPIYNPATYNPLTGTNQQFSGNLITTINPFATAWMQLYPTGQPTTASNPYNFAENLTTVSNYNEYLGRGDWNISSKDHLYGSGLHLNAPNFTPTIISGLFGAAHTNIGTNVAIEETHVFNNHLVNTARLGYNRTNYFFTQQGAGLKDYAQEYGLNGVSAIPSQSTPPYIAISDITSNGSPYTPQGAIANRFQYADELNMTFGKHVLYVGGEYVRTQYFGDWTINNNAQYAFNGVMTAQYTGLNSSGAPIESTTNTGNGLADLLLGLPQSASHSLGVVAAHFFDSTFAGYVQDNWKLTSKFTLTLGLRYEVFTPPNTKNGTEPEATSYNFASDANQRGAWKTNYGDLGPRFGFAYSVRPHTVVRGGYGIYYAENPYNNEQFMLTYPPNFVGQGVVQTIYSNPVGPGSPTNLQDVFTLPGETVPPGERYYTNNPNEMKDTSFQEWNLTVEQQLTNNTTLTAAYIGDVTHHQVVRYDGDMPDAATPGSAILNVWPIASLGESIMTEATITNSNYNALVLTLNRHFSSGLQLLANYTWSRGFGINTGDNDLVENIYHLRYQYAPLAFDQPQVFNLSGTYLLPAGKGRRFLSSGPWGSVLGDWQVAGIWTLAKAPPTPVSAADDADSSTVTSFYATKVCNPYTGNFTQSHADWFNTSCFVQPALGQYGIGGHNELTGPHSNNADISLSKIVRIKEQSQLQIRADFLNAFNHPQFILGGQSVNGGAAYGALTSAYPQRIVQVSLRLSF